MTIPAYIQELVEEYREPLGLDRWVVRLENGPSPEGDEATAACTAAPEYRDAVIRFDCDRLRTNDEVEELVAHEMVHAVLWPLHEEAEWLADLAANSLPESHRAAFKEHLAENVRRAAERVATDMGQILLRYHRRLRQTRNDLIREAETNGMCSISIATS